MLEVRARLPKLRKIVVFDMEGLHELRRSAGHVARALRAAGPRATTRAHPGEWERRIGIAQGRGPGDPRLHLGHHRQAQGRDDLAPNILLTLRAATRAPSRRTSATSACAFLPLCHIAERVGGEYHALYSGAVLNFVENPETVPENVREIAPTVFSAVPRVWEKFYSAIADPA